MFKALINLYIVHSQLESADGFPSAGLPSLASRENLSKEDLGHPRKWRKAGSTWQKRVLLKLLLLSVSSPGAHTAVFTKFILWIGLNRWACTESYIFLY